MAMELTDAQGCSLYLESSVTAAGKEPDCITMVAGAGFETSRIGVAQYQKGQGLTGGIWQSSRSVKYDTRKQIEDPANGWKGLFNPAVRTFHKQWICYSLIGVPLLVGGRAIGVLKVENKKPAPPSAFSQEDRVMLEFIASTFVKLHA
jgi:signal transduction protein with GAF and PtsI domain